MRPNHRLIEGSSSVARPGRNGAADSPFEITIGIQSSSENEISQVKSGKEMSNSGSILGASLLLVGTTAFFSW